MFHSFAGAASSVASSSALALSEPAAVVRAMGAAASAVLPGVPEFGDQGAHLSTSAQFSAEIPLGALRASGGLGRRGGSALQRNLALRSPPVALRGSGGLGRRGCLVLQRNLALRSPLVR